MAKKKTPTAPTPPDDAPPVARAPLVIEHVDPATLVPDPKNPRQITPESRARLKRGIERFGMPVPLLARSEDRVVIGGHQRLTLALELEMPTVPVIFRAGMTIAEARALNVLLNNTKAQGEWQMDALRDFMADIRADDFDVTLTGFDAAYVEQMFADALALKPGTEWGGMPSFEQDDLLTIKQLVVKFRREEDVASFAVLVGQSITMETKSITYPPEPRMSVKQVTYASAPVPAP